MKRFEEKLVTKKSLQPDHYKTNAKSHFFSNNNNNMNPLVPSTLSQNNGPLKLNNLARFMTRSSQESASPEVKKRKVESEEGELNDLASSQQTQSSQNYDFHDPPESDDELQHFTPSPNFLDEEEDNIQRETLPHGYFQTVKEGELIQTKSLQKGETKQFKEEMETQEEIETRQLQEEIETKQLQKEIETKQLQEEIERQKEIEMEIQERLKEKKERQKKRKAEIKQELEKEKEKQNQLERELQREKERQMVLEMELKKEKERQKEIEMEIQERLKEERERQKKRESEIEEKFKKETERRKQRELQLEKELKRKEIEDDCNDTPQHTEGPTKESAASLLERFKSRISRLDSKKTTCIPSDTSPPNRSPIKEHQAVSPHFKRSSSSPSAPPTRPKRNNNQSRLAQQLFPHSDSSCGSQSTPERSQSTPNFVSFVSPISNQDLTPPEENQNDTAQPVSPDLNQSQDAFLYQEPPRVLVPQSSQIYTLSQNLDSPFSSQGNPDMNLSNTTNNNSTNLNYSTNDTSRILSDQNNHLGEKVEPTVNLQHFGKKIITDENFTKKDKTAKTLKVKISMSDISSRVTQKRQKAENESSTEPDKFDKPLFLTNLTTSNSDAESEFRRVFKKEYFKKMSIVGQFNKGFILGKLNSDLFIIDQHASDEKFNYETLQKTTVISSQPLFNPEPLSLASDEELIIIDNLKVFQMNGFDFQIDHSAPPTKKLKLTSKPFSHKMEFGTFDIFELISLLRDTPGELCRISRVSAMFASRACRKSVMIGTSLGHPEMRKILDHMSELEQPWHCPHGRPTMRHVVDLNLLK